MNKQILLILATALSQIVNILQGAPTETAAPAPSPEPKPAKKNGKAKKAPEPVEEEEEIEVEEDEDEEITVVEEEDEDEVDVEALKKEAKKLVTALIAKDPTNSKKVRAILDSAGESNIGNADAENVPGILAQLKKIK